MLIEKTSNFSSSIKFLKSILARRIFFMGQPGSSKQENAMAIADYFQWRFISVSDILQREEAKKSEDGKRITDCLK